MLRVNMVGQLNLVIIVLFTTLLGSSNGQDDPKTGKNALDPAATQKQKKSLSANVVAQLSVAYQLVDVGRNTKSPLALLTAAELLHQNPIGTLDAEPTHEEGKGEIAPKAPSAKKDRPEITVAGLIAEAKTLAGNDANLLAVVQKVAERTEDASRGAVGGPKKQITSVAALGTDLYKLAFRAEEPAIVIVSGDGDTDLDLYVYDELGNLIASDDDGQDDCIVRFTPKWTGPFIVRVVNRGLVYNRYIIATN